MALSPFSALIQFSAMDEHDTYYSQHYLNGRTSRDGMAFSREGLVGTGRCHRNLLVICQNC